MAIAVEGTQTNITEATNYSPNAGDDRLVILSGSWVLNGNNQVLTALTFDGASMAQDVLQGDNAGGVTGLPLIASALETGFSGSGQFDWTFSGGILEFNAQALTLSGVDQDTPLVDTDTTIDSSGGAALSVSAEEGGIVVGTILSDSVVPQLPAGTTSVFSAAGYRTFYRLVSETGTENFSFNTGGAAHIAVVASYRQAAAAEPREVEADTEAISLTPQASGVSRSRGVEGQTDALSIIGHQSSINFARTVSANTEALSCQAFPADIERTEHREVEAQAEVLSVAGQAAGVTRARGVSGVTTSLAIASHAAAASRDRGVVGATDQLSLTAQPSAVQTDRGVLADAGALSVQTFPAQVLRGQNRVVTCTAEILSIVGQGAAVTRFENREVLADTESLSITGHTAGIFRGSNLQVSASTGVLSVSGEQAEIRFDRSVLAGFELLSLDPHAALINRTRDLQAFAEALSIQTFGASVIEGAIVRIRGATASVRHAGLSAGVSHATTTGTPSEQHSSATVRTRNLTASVSHSGKRADLN